jgi:hypothetical protein
LTKAVASEEVLVIAVTAGALPKNWNPTPDAKLIFPDAIKGPVATIRNGQLQPL